MGQRARESLILGLAVGCIGLLCASPAGAIPPTIESQSVSGITETSATLEAEIDPQNLEGGAFYQFQLVTDPDDFWPAVTCPEMHPNTPPVVQCLGPYGTIDGPPPVASILRRPGDLPTERLFGSADPQAVSLDLGTIGRVLEPETTYHFRVLAVEAFLWTVDTIVWEDPPGYGPDQTFTTLGEDPPHPPDPGEPDPQVQTPVPAGDPVPTAPTLRRAQAPRRCQKAKSRRVKSRRISKRAPRPACKLRAARAR